MQNYFALIPAAGQGARMGSELPKQYLALLGKPMIYHAIKRFFDSPRIACVYVVLAPDDVYWLHYDWSEFGDKLKPLHCGGETRHASVLNGLNAIYYAISPKDWVLVHDAARPCLSDAQLEKLCTSIVEDDVGGLLAVPVSDTLKREDAEQRVSQTERREGLWQAQTPQMFHYGLLVKALESMDGEAPTDESRAIEHLELHPKLIESDSMNLKVTYPHDLELAELILENRDGQRNHNQK
jgi:2-C-methyl-D-erythritol 4-phosphate cytidylyltransferase